MAQRLQSFQYDTPTIVVGNLTLDAVALNCYIRRAVGAYGIGVDYSMSNQNWSAGKKLEPGTKVDCTGFAWWCTYRARQVGGLWPANKNWLELKEPIAGCAVRRGALPGQSSGHAGVVIACGADNFSTLDSSSTDPKPREGAIRYTQNGKALWETKPECHFVVSDQAVIAVNGVPYKRPLNLFLAAAKRPIATAAAGVGLLAVVGASLGWWSLQKRST